jgi:hypothetical protein
LRSRALARLASQRDAGDAPDEEKYDERDQEHAQEGNKHYHRVAILKFQGARSAAGPISPASIESVNGRLDCHTLSPAAEQAADVTRSVDDSNDGDCVALRAMKTT